MTGISDSRLSIYEHDEGLLQMSTAHALAISDAYDWDIGDLMDHLNKLVMKQRRKSA